MDSRAVFFCLECDARGGFYQSVPSPFKSRALEKQLCLWEGIVLSQSKRTFLICLKSVLLTLGAVGGRFALGTSVQVRGVGVLCNSQC